ncbi:hypothetical protein INR49_002297 [Caranx melampygus]|nr:hypothetical protein INR49_002297 [Caranx melampygus]
MVPRGAFTVPLLLVCAVSAITVPPPENVTLSCDNLNTTVSWDYRDREPGTSSSSPSSPLMQRCNSRNLRPPL